MPEVTKKEMEEILEKEYNSIPTDEEILDVANKWASYLSSDHHRLYANKDFAMGAIWGLKIVKAKLETKDA